MKTATRSRTRTLSPAAAPATLALATLLALAGAGAGTLPAQTTKGVTTISSNTTESDINYANTATGAGPLLTINTGITYSGTNINLTSPSSNATNGKWLLRLNNGATATIHGGTFTVTHPTNTANSGGLIHLYSGASPTRFTGYNLFFSASSPVGRAFSIGGNAPLNTTLEIHDSFAQSLGDRYALVDFEGNGNVLFTSSTLRTTGTAAPAVQFRNNPNNNTSNFVFADGVISTAGVDSPAFFTHPQGSGQPVFTDNITLINSLVSATQAVGLDVNADIRGAPNFPNTSNAPAGGWNGTVNLDLDHTPMTGGLAGLRVTTGVFHSSGSRFEVATTVNATLVNSSTLAGGILLDGSAKLNLAVDATSLVTGGIAIADKAILNLNQDVLDRIEGGLAITGAGALSVAATGAAGPALFTRDLSLSGSSSIRFEGDTLFSGILTFADSAGIIIANVSGTDLTLAPGAGFNGDPALRIENITADALGRATIPLIIDTTGAGLLATSSLTLVENEIPGTARVDFGRYGYSLVTTATTAELVLTRRQFRNAASGTWNISDMTYESTPAGTQHAFYLDGTGDLAGSTFTGSNITILAGGTGNNTGRMALVVTGGAEATIHGGTFAQTAANAADSLTTANYLYANSKLTLTDAVLYATGPKIRALGIQSSTTDGAYLTLERSLVYTTGTAPAFIFGGRGYVTMRSSTLATHGSSAPGAQFRGSNPEFYFSDGEITTHGVNSPGMWMGGAADFAGLTQMKIALKNSRVSSDTAAGIDVNTFIPALNDLPDTRAVQPSWFADFDITAENTTIAGPAAALRVTSRPYWSSNVNAYASSTIFFGEVPTTVRFNLKNTGTLDGDVLLTATPDHTAARAASLATVESPRSLTPPVTATLILNLDHSVLAGAYRADARTSSTIALLASSTVTGAIALSGNAAAAITLAGASTVNGAITLADSSTAAITFDASSRLAGGVIATGAATVTLDPSAGGAVSAPVTLSGVARLFIARPITLDGPLNLDDAGTAIAFGRVAGRDLVLGDHFTLAGNGKITVAGIAPAAAGLEEIPLIAAPAGNFPAGALTLEGGVIDYGLAGYTLDTRADGAWLVGGVGSVGAAMYDTPATAATEWFAGLAPVLSHLASLRPASPPSGAARGDTGTLWLDARASYLTAAGAGNLSFNQHTNALAVGGDSTWNLSAGTALAGFFADYAATARDFARDTDGATAAAGAGLYAEWRHPRGLFLGALARATQSKHEFSSNDPANRLDAEYKTREFGLAAELGWHLAHAATGFWLEPSAQAALVRLGGDDYAIRRDNGAGDDLAVNLAASTARHYRAQVRAGRDAGAWRWHVSLGAAHIAATGGAVSVPAQPGLPIASFALAGDRAELGLGCQRVIGQSGLLRLDWSYVKSRHYELPWSLALAYRHLW
jgi:outer membrane autotransporter protein